MGKSPSWVFGRKHLLEIWDFDKNVTASPTDSKWDDLAFWKCATGHSYLRKIGYQARSVSCTICSGREVLSGVNDLLSRSPDIASEWDYDKNELSPDQVLVGSNSRFFWVCKGGHRWEAFLPNRVRKKQGCPFCDGTRPIPGKTDFGTVSSAPAAEWHPTKNGHFKPRDFLPMSDKRAWFVCALGHEWETQIKSRSKGRGCPTCSGRIVESGFNDLSTTHPKVAERWNVEKNGGLLPNAVSVGGGPYRFTCPSGHDFEAFPSNLSRKPSACPVCSSKIVIPGVNDFATLFPQLSLEWHPTKNRQRPDVVPRNGKNSHWWQCEHGHEWKATTSTRISGHGCPVCSGYATLEGYNDLASQFPNLMTEWATDLNGDVSPSATNKNSNDKAWWRCDDGHVWRAQVSTRTRLGVGCPSCHSGGYSPSQPGFLYLLRRDATGQQQFGITNVPDSRLATHRRSDWEVLDLLGPLDGVWVAEVEDSLKAFFLSKGLLYRRDHPEKFDGYTEAWDASEVTYLNFKTLLNDLREWESS